MGWLPVPVRRKLLTELQRQYLTLNVPRVVKAPLTWVEKQRYGKVDSVPIEKPIFIIGCNRSGTTVLYEMLAKHPDVAFFTNASALVPELEILNNTIGEFLGLGEIKQERFLKDALEYNYGTPAEGIRIWDYYLEDRPDHILDETYDDPEMEAYLKTTIRKHLHHFHCSRFLSKNPDNSVRIRYYHKIFPDALFINIIRDGRAVTHSLLKSRQNAVEFFGPDHPHAQHGTKVRNWLELKELFETDPIVSVGLLWKEVVEAIERDRQYIPAEQFLEIRFEDFVSAPAEYVDKLLKFAQLRQDPEVDEIFQKEVSKINMGKRNEAWREKFTLEEQQRLIEAIGEKIRAYGYEVEEPV